MILKMAEPGKAELIMMFLNQWDHSTKRHAGCTLGGSYQESRMLVES